DASAPAAEQSPGSDDSGLLPTAPVLEEVEKAVDGLTSGEEPKEDDDEKGETGKKDTKDASSAQDDPPSWGLDRSDQREPPLDDSYGYDSAGAGVTAYVIDTGVRVSHEDFGGRARSGYDFVDDDADADDCHGHGTHVAGTVGGSDYGVAKNVDVVGV